MAGSYAHLTGDGGWSMIENMGDAYETVEELWWLVEKAIGEQQAHKLLDDYFYPMKRGEQPRDNIMIHVENGMNH